MIIRIWLIGIMINLVLQLILWMACYTAVTAARTDVHTEWSAFCVEVLQAAGVTPKECADTVDDPFNGLLSVAGSILWPITFPMGIYTALKSNH